MNRSKKIGDRRDAIKVRNIDALHKLMLFIKPRRCDSDVYINQKIDCTNLVKYVEEKKKDIKDLTYFHVFCTAVAKVLYNKPLLNRYVINKNFYDRKDVTLSFVAKVKFTDDAPEYMNILKIEKDDTINEIKDKISGVVKDVRNDKKSGTDGIIDLVGKMPKFVQRIIVWVVKMLDNYDLLPSTITDNLIYYSSVILSNLGSIDCGAIYHNLTDFGTNSIVITMGKIHKEMVVNDKGVSEIRSICDFGINLDERIADGVYFAKSVKLLQYIIENPDMLENKVSEIINEE